MFGFLKNLGRPPRAELLYYEDGVIHFRCPSTLAPKKKVNLQCLLPDGETFGGIIQVMQHDRDRELYTGFMEHPQNANQFLAQLLPVPFQDRRRGPRLRGRVRLTSRDLPGYKSMTENVSLHGFCTLIEGPLAPDRIMDIELDLDVSGIRPMQLQVRVCWCASSGPRHYLVGCSFEKMTRGNRQQIEKFLENLGQLAPKE